MLFIQYMNNTEIELQAKNIFIEIYEWKNEVYLNGILPEKNTIEYEKAKEIALRKTWNYDNLEIHFYILDKL